MTEQHKPGPPLGPDVEMVSYDDALRYLGALGVKSLCPACGHDEAGILTSSDDSSVRCFYLGTKLFHSDYSVSGNLPGVAVWMTDCIQCGHMRQFGYGRLVDWVRNNPHQEEVK